MRRNKKKITASVATKKPFTMAGEAGIQAASGEGQLPSFQGNAYTGAVIQPCGWYGSLVVDLAGVRSSSQQRPVLRQHDHEQIVGHTTAIGVDGGGIKVAGVFSGQQEHVDKVVVPAKNGFKWQLSIGADPVRVEYLEAGEETIVNGAVVCGPCTISRETELGEISFVPLGADDATSVSVAAQKKGDEMNPFKLALKSAISEIKAKGKAPMYSHEDIDGMTDDEVKSVMLSIFENADITPERPIQAGVATLDRAALTAEIARCREIDALCKRHGIDKIKLADGNEVVLSDHAAADGWTVDRVKGYVLDHIRAERPSTPTVPGGLAFSTSTPVVSDSVLEAAIFQGSRHQYQLENDSFYLDNVPGGPAFRRVPEYLQRQTQSEIKARYNDQVQQSAHTLFRGRISPKQFFKLALKSLGHHGDLDLSSESGVRSMMQSWDHLERNRITAEGSSNVSVSNVLANVMGKFALQGYLYVEQAWRQIAGIKPVNDFKPIKSINLLGDAMFKALGSNSELAHASLGDQAFSNQAAPTGRILTIPYTHIVNDDLGMFSQVPMKMGQGAGLALNDSFWTVWANMAAGTVNGDDGNAFWRTTSSTTTAAKLSGTAYKPNKTSGGGSALSSTSLATVKALFDNQVDPNGNPLGFNGFKPIMLFGPTNWPTAMNLLYASSLVYGGSASGAATPNNNPWAGYFEPVMSRYIENASYVNSTTAWWMLFSPMVLPAIEVSFLNGVDVPSVLQAGPDYQFDRLGISIRGTMPFGVNQQNFRGGVYSVGA